MKIRNIPYKKLNKTEKKIIDAFYKERGTMKQGITKYDFVEYHLNRFDFKDTKNHIWLIGQNSGGIGKPLIDLDEDVKWFVEEYKSKVREAIIKKGNKLAYDRANHIQSAYQEKLIIVQLSILEDLLKELGLTEKELKQ